MSNKSLNTTRVKREVGRLYLVIFASTVVTGLCLLSALRLVVASNPAQFYPLLLGLFCLLCLVRALASRSHQSDFVAMSEEGVAVSVAAQMVQELGGYEGLKIVFDKSGANTLALYRIWGKPVLVLSQKIVDVVGGDISIVPGEIGYNLLKPFIAHELGHADTPYLYTVLEFFRLSQYFLLCCVVSLPLFSFWVSLSWAALFVLAATLILVRVLQLQVMRCYEHIADLKGCILQGEVNGALTSLSFLVAEDALPRDRVEKALSGLAFLLLAAHPLKRKRLGLVARFSA